MPTRSVEPFVEHHPDPVTLSSYGHLAINLGLGTAATLAAVLGAEWALHMIKNHQHENTSWEQDNFIREKELEWESEKAAREQEALEVLVKMAENHARTFSLDDFEGKFESYKIPKEIHETLESIFREGAYGTPGIRSWKDLKENLKPLLDFE